MPSKNGLNREERLRSVHSAPPFAVTDSDPAALLRQARQLASFIRYHHFENVQDGYFDVLLNELGQQTPEDQMEPSQALLLTFVTHLHEIAERFNRRWQELPNWYLREVLALRPLRPVKDRIWIAIPNDTSETIHVRSQELSFKADLPAGGQIGYGLQEEMEIHPLQVVRTYSVQSASDNTPLPGFILSSPTLLLAEGERLVTIRFETESEIPAYPFDNAFNLWISTESGWSEVRNSSLRVDPRSPDHLTLTFSLPEQFPPTTGCETELHGLQAQYPAIRVYLDPGASWLGDYLLKRIVLCCSVRGITNLQVYNELGQVDVSKPFAPFGVNIEKGAWFVVGSYEMAMKQTDALDLNITWGQLPESPTGMEGHYREYEQGINNDSFQVEARYLSHYNWESSQQTFPLFRSRPGTDEKHGWLDDRKVLAGIDIHKMPPVCTTPEQYAYSMGTRDGFVNLTLTNPAMGFGEKRYRTLFTDQLLRQSLKKKEQPSIQAPYRPQLERITMNYRSEDCIDLRYGRSLAGTGLWHIYPLGIHLAFPQADKQQVPLIYNTPATACLMWALRGVRGGECARFYADMAPMYSERESREEVSQKWFWGNGYDWHSMPDGMIVRDTTSKLTTSGCLELHFPEHINRDKYDLEGLLWICAGFESGYGQIPALRGIYPNAAELLQADDLPESLPPDASVDLILKPEQDVPGIKTVEQITACLSRPGAPENNVCQLLRVSEYVTHRGKGITARDFERIVLQHFPQIAQAKCYPVSPDRSAPIVVIVPEQTQGELLRAPDDLIRSVREYVGTISRLPDSFRVISPVYEDIMIRCQVRFKAFYSEGSCRHRLSQLCNELIAPWQAEKTTPELDKQLDARFFYDTLAEQDYVQELEQFSLIRLISDGEKRHLVREYTLQEPIVRGDTPYTVFVPAAEHLFVSGDTASFGIPEMGIGSTFVIQ